MLANIFKPIRMLSQTFKNHIHNNIVTVACKWFVPCASDVFLSKNDNFRRGGIWYLFHGIWFLSCVAIFQGGRYGRSDGNVKLPNINQSILDNAWLLLPIFHFIVIWRTKICENRHKMCSKHLSFWLLKPNYIYITFNLYLI